ncbi:MAG: cobalamin biosynthesis protein [Acidimicrobiales bacterium]
MVRSRPGFARRPLAAAAGLVVDELIGEPRLGPHPVAIFGRVMRRIEVTLYGDRRSRGVIHAMAGATIGVAGGTALRVDTAAAYLAIAGRSLREAAAAVAVPLRAGDLDAARGRLPSLVGRDPTGLDAKEVTRAVVESLAENTVDAVVAPAVWAAVGGARGALAYRAVNTMDAMVGYRSERYERYGWASARLDDLANWIPARVTALLVMVVRPGAAGAGGKAVRTQAPSHPSPTSGVAEAAFAAALGIRLGGTNVYAGRTQIRPALGSGPTPDIDDIVRATDLSRDVGRALAIGLLAFSLSRRGARS